MNHACICKAPETHRSADGFDYCGICEKPILCSFQVHEQQAQEDELIRQSQAALDALPVATYLALTQGSWS